MVIGERIPTPDGPGERITWIREAGRRASPVETPTLGLGEEGALWVIGLQCGDVVQLLVPVSVKPALMTVMVCPAREKCLRNPNPSA